ncbi:MAG TPA: hypothetical protein VGK23_08935 [Methanomassiliicoccales archaeon]
MGYPNTPRPLSSKILMALLVFYGILGLISGALLIADPTGGGLGFDSNIVEKVPLHSFLLVGLFLFFIYGMGSLVLAYGALTRNESVFRKVSEVSGYHWSWTGGMLLTLVLVIWLAVEGSLIGLDWPATYFTVVIGVGIFVMLILPSTRRYYQAR